MTTSSCVLDILIVYANAILHNINIDINISINIKIIIDIAVIKNSYNYFHRTRILYNILINISMVLQYYYKKITNNKT